jgi:hypothetical protein
MGIPEIEAKQYEGKIKDGNILISIHVDTAEERDRAKQILESANATNVVNIGEQHVPA